MEKFSGVREVREAAWWTQTLCNQKHTLLENLPSGGISVSKFLSDDHANTILKKRDPVHQPQASSFVHRTWTGTTQRDGMGREEGGGFRMGNTCIPVADSF